MREVSIAVLFAASICGLLASALDAADGPPVIYWVSEPVLPGETALVLGHGFGETPKIELVRLPDGAPGTPPAEQSLVWPGGGRPVRPIQAREVSVKFIVPEEMGTGIYAFHIGNEGGWSRVVLLNRPSPLWVQGDQGETASPGGWVRIFGVSLQAKPSQAATVILEGKRGLVRLDRREGSPYSLWADVPKDTAEGEYRVRVHLGIGGIAGWSAPLAITVQRLKPWPDTAFNVIEFGADSMGQKDSTGAIQAALDKAGQNGGVVFFPRGKYFVSATLEVPRFVTLRGEGRHLACLFWPDSEQPLKELIKGTNSFGIEDLTLYCSNYVHFIAADQNVPDAGDVKIRRVCIRADIYRGHLKPEEVDARFKAALRNSTGGGDLLRLGGRNVEVTDCDLYASGRSIFLDRVRCGRIANNTIYNGRWGWYCFMGSDRLIFENNLMAGGDLMSTGGGLANYATAYSRCIYFGHNIFKNMFGWDREAITSDAGGGAYYGKIISANGTSLMLAETPNWGKRDWIGAGVFIVAGRGQGQWREIVRYENEKVEVDRPWDVAPDATSLLEITMQHRHYLMIGNEFHDAGIGVQFYGTNIECIVAANKTSRAGGYNNIGKPYGGYHLPPDKNPCHQPSWRCQYFDNEIVEGNVYRGHANNAVASGDSHIGVFGWPIKQDWPWPYNVGTIVRRNVLHNNAKIHVGTASNPQFPSVTDCIVEGNVIRNADIGIQVDGGTSGVLLRKNTFEGVKSPMTGAGMAHAHVHPADVALSRLRGLLCLLPEKARLGPAPAEFTGAEKELKALQSQPAEKPGLADQVKKAFEAGLAAYGRACPEGYSSEFLEKVLGAKVAVAKEDKLGSVIESGAGGSADFCVEVSLGEGFGEATITVGLELPRDWRCGRPVSAPIPLTGGQARTFAFPIQIPPRTWGKYTLPLTVEAAAGQARFRCNASVTIGGAFIRDWLVIGPFPNKSKLPLDTSCHPPEEEMNLSKEYPGFSGPVRWQPVTLAGNCLDLGRLMKTNQPATAYALTCLVAEDEMPITLGLGCDDGAKVWVNGEEVLSCTRGGRAAPRQERAQTRLVKGENVIFCKISNTGASWQQYLSLEENAEVLRKVQITPADKIPSLRVFAPSAGGGRLSATVPGGPFAYEGQVEWKLLFEDDFSRLTLGSRWLPLRGSWAIIAGKLVTRQTGIIAIATTVKPPLRIEFDASSQNPGDLTAFWGTKDKGYEGGYFVGFGSNNNTLNKILRYGQQVLDASTILITKGKVHHVVAQVIASPGLPAIVELLVDGKLAIRYRDPQPITDADTPGLIAWSEGEFDNVRVWQGRMIKGE